MEDEHVSQDSDDDLVKNQIIVRCAEEGDYDFAIQIADEMERSALARGSGISKRTPASIREKIKSGKAVIAIKGDKEWVGFSYLEVWENGKFVSNSGMIVRPEYRNCGVATKIKNMVFHLSRTRYPEASIFSITSGLAIMKMNTKLGFEPVTYSEITHENTFWEGCKSCVNYDLLNSKHRCNCLCTAMLFNPCQDSSIQIDRPVIS